MIANRDGNLPITIISSLLLYSTKTTTNNPINVPVNAELTYHSFKLMLNCLINN